MQQRGWPFGIAPERTDDPQTAVRLVDVEGVAILCGCGTESVDATESAQLVLGARLAALSQPMALGGTTERSDSCSRFSLHSSGFGFADAYPDMVFFLCAEEPADGGEFRVADLAALYEHLRAEPATGAHASELETRSVVQSRHRQAVVRSPVIRRTSSGRVAARVSPLSRPDPDSATRRADEELVGFWRRSAQAAGACGIGFRLETGEMLCIDNYRLGHASSAERNSRDRYWQVLGWSSDCLSVPSTLVPKSAA